MHRYILDNEELCVRERSGVVLPMITVIKVEIKASEKLDENDDTAKPSEGRKRM